MVLQAIGESRNVSTSDRREQQWSYQRQVERQWIYRR